MCKGHFLSAETMLDFKHFIGLSKEMVLFSDNVRFSESCFHLTKENKHFSKFYHRFVHVDVNLEICAFEKALLGEKN